MVGADVPNRVMVAKATIHERQKLEPVVYRGFRPSPE
jgi:hypothetical protein